MLVACQAVCGSVEAVCGRLEGVCLVAQAVVCLLRRQPLCTVVYRLVAQAPTVYQGRVSCRLSASVSCLFVAAFSFLLPPSRSCCRPVFVVATLFF